MLASLEGSRQQQVDHYSHREPINEECYPVEDGNCHRHPGRRCNGFSPYFVLSKKISKFAQEGISR